MAGKVDQAKRKILRGVPKQRAARGDQCKERIGAAERLDVPHEQVDQRHCGGYGAEINMEHDLGTKQQHHDKEDLNGGITPKRYQVQATQAAPHLLQRAALSSLVAKVATPGEKHGQKRKDHKYERKQDQRAKKNKHKLHRDCGQRGKIRLCRLGGDQCAE